MEPDPGDDGTPKAGFLRSHRKPQAVNADN